MKLWMRIELPELTGGSIGSTVGFLVEREEFCHGYPVYPGVLVCTICLTPWARLSWLDRPDPIYEIRGLVCTGCARPAALHRDLSPVPGSIIHNNTVNCDLELLSELPSPLLEREFDLHMKYFPMETL